MAVLEFIGALLGIGAAVTTAVLVVQLVIITVQEVVRAVRNWWGRVRNAVLYNPKQSSEVRQLIQNLAKTSKPIKRLVVNHDSEEVGLLEANSIDSNIDSYGPIAL